MDSIQYLLSIETRGIKLGFQRTRQIMKACDNPHIGMPSIQVAGTNGKGSVCAMLANILKTADYKTGLYTSPHLVNVNERIRINGVPISNKEIDIFIRKYKTDIEKIGATFFETITAMAFWYFKKTKVDVAVLETGLGGRLDSVSICEPMATIITPISLDHLEILGDTLSQITFEKAGILKKGVACISAQQEDSATEVLIEEAKKKETTIQFLNGDGSSEFQLNIQGKSQHENARLTVSALSLLKDFNISEKMIADGLKSVEWCGRNQIVQENPIVIFDVAHNLAGMNSFLEYYKNLHITGDSVLVISLQARKQIQPAIPIFQAMFKYIVCTETSGRNPMPANILKNLFFDDRIKIIRNPEEAILWGIGKLASRGGMAIIGSHYLGPAVSNIFKISFNKY